MVRAFLIAIVWYNWETLRRMKGLTNRSNILYFSFAILILLFGVYLAMNGFFRVVLMLDTGQDEWIKLAIVLSVTEILFGASLLLHVVRTIRLYVPWRKSFLKKIDLEINFQPDI